MKVLIITMTILTMIQFVNAREKVIEVRKRDFFETAKVDLALGYTSSSYKLANKEGDSEDVGGKGVQLRGGLKFELPSSFTTTSSVVANFIGHDEKEIGIEIKGLSFKSRDFGVSQDIAYNLSFKDIVFSPFLGVSLSRGRESLEIQSTSLKTGYSKLGLNLGLQVNMGNNIMPFIKYETSYLKRDSSAKIEGDHSTEEMKVEERNVSLKALTVGVGYQF